MANKKKNKPNAILTKPIIKPEPEKEGKRWQPWLIAGVIALVTYIVFSPSLKNGFTNWDDPAYVLENYLVVNHSVPLKEIFTTPISYNYHPLTILSLAWNFQNGQLDPTGYHEENVLFHILNTILVFFLIFLLTRRNLLMAGIVSLFFGIHPMHVESVSWVSERKDVLYVFFFLAGLITYLCYSETKKIIWYLTTLTLFVLSCLSKGMAVVFPMVLLLIDYLRSVKWEKKVVIEKIPFFIIALGFGITAYVIQSDEPIAETQFFTIFQRLMFASYGTIMYVVKLIVPFGLSAFYPYPTLAKNGSVPVIFYLSPFIVLAFAGLIYYYFRKNRVIVFGLLFYFVTVVLVLQFISVGSALWADRYSYLSYIGLLFVAAYIINKAWEAKTGSWTYLKYPLVIIAGIGAIIFSSETYARTQIWKNSETLWTDVIAKIGNVTQADRAYINRGRYYHSIQQNDKALSDYNMTIKLNPSYDMAYNNRGNIYREQGQNDLALRDYKIAMALKPDDYLPYSNCALIYRDKKEYDLALNCFAKSISLNPYYWANYYNRGVYYSMVDSNEKAIKDLNNGIQLNYTYPDLYYWRALTLRKLNKNPDALADLSRAIQLNPAVPNYWAVRSVVETALGEKQQALEDMKQAKQLLGMK